jgi:hypothetical protein
VQPGPLATLARTGLADLVGRENITGDIQAALARARALLDAGATAPGA